MSLYHTFLVNETDRFDATNFPQLGVCLEQLVNVLNRESPGPKADMVLSFVKDHSMKSQHVTDHPKLASLISTKSLPLGAIEALFTSCRNNPSFQKDLEGHIRTFFATARLY